MKNNLFIAPASYFIENLEGQEKEKFKNGIFQYDNMICGMVEKTDFVNDRVLCIVQSSRRQIRRTGSISINRPLWC